MLRHLPKTYFVFSLLLVITMHTTSKAQPAFKLNDKISSVLFNPGVIYFKGDSIKEGHAIIAWPFWDRVVYTSDIKSDVVKEDEYEVFDAKDTEKVTINNKTFYPMTVKGSAGIYTFIHKMYENNSIVFYAGHDDKEKLIEEGKTIIFIKHKNEEKAERMIINFKEFDKPMPKKVIKNIGECEAVSKAVNSGKYHKSVDDFIKLLDIYDQECGTDN